MAKGKHDDWKEVRPSRNYYSFKDDGDELVCTFQENTEDWEGKPCALVVDEDGQEFFVGGQGLLERLLTAKKGDKFMIHAGEKNETGNGRTFRNYRVYSPPGQHFTDPTPEQIADLRNRLNAKSF